MLALNARLEAPGRGPYLASLSTWSPKPGVSTMVREIRVPSSSSSSSARRVSYSSFSTWWGSCLSVPTVMGLILTPSSTWAPLGSSESLWPITDFPQRVLTKVVLPGNHEEAVSKRITSIAGS